MAENSRIETFLYALTTRGDWLARIVSRFWFRWRCPCPILPDHSVRACVQAGVCGCDNADRRASRSWRLARCDGGTQPGAGRGAEGSGGVIYRTWCWLCYQLVMHCPVNRTTRFMFPVTLWLLPWAGEEMHRRGEL
jgi:hypothetical protein